MKLSLSIITETITPALKRFKADHKKETSAMLKDAAEIVRRRLETKYLNASGPSPFALQKHTGGFLASVRVVKKGADVEIGSNHPGAAVHEFGATIRAKFAPYLRFKTQDGAWHSVKQVTIPARHPFDNAIHDSEDTILRNMELRAGRFIGRLGLG